MKVFILVCSFLILLIIIDLWECPAVQFDPSAIPSGSVLFKLYPLVHMASARFDESGKAVNFTQLSQLSHVDTQIELHYGVTDSLMAGVLLPVEYIRRTYITGELSTIVDIANPWIIIKHQFWSEGVYASSSLRVKLPITEVDPMEIDPIVGGLDVDDKQFDIFPIYYVTWMMRAGTYISGHIGYKYRFKNDHIKPSDELKLLLETGYAIVPGIIRIFTYSDYTRFFGAMINDERDDLSRGYRYTFGAGVRFFLGRNLRIEFLTNADPFGRNQLRNIGGHVGIGWLFRR